MRERRAQAELLECQCGVQGPEAGPSPTAHRETETGERREERGERREERGREREVEQTGVSEQL